MSEDLSRDLFLTYRELKPNLVDVSSEQLDRAHLEYATRTILAFARRKALVDLAGEKGVELSRDPHARATFESYHLLGEDGQGGPVVSDAPYLAEVKGEIMNFPDTYGSPTTWPSPIPSMSIEQRLPLKKAQERFEALGKGGLRSLAEKAKWFFGRRYDILKDKILFTDGEISEPDEEGLKHINGGSLTVISRQVSAGDKNSLLYRTLLIAPPDASFEGVDIEHFDVYLDGETFKQLESRAEKYVGEGLERHRQGLERERQLYHEIDKEIAGKSLDEVDRWLADKVRAREKEQKGKKKE